MATVLERTLEFARTKKKEKKCCIFVHRYKKLKIQLDSVKVSASCTYVQFFDLFVMSKLKLAPAKQNVISGSQRKAGVQHMTSK